MLSAIELVDLVRKDFGRSECQPLRLLAALGWGLRERELQASGGGQDALLVPRTAGGFDVVVDPGLSASQHWMRRTGNSRALGRSAVWFRIAHEIGHSFFFEPGSPPRRRCSATEAEESFCDQFAAVLMIGETREPSAIELTRRAARLGGNLEVSALSLVATHTANVTMRRGGSVVLELGAHPGGGCISTARLGDVEIRVAA